MENQAGVLLAEPAASLRLMSEQEFKLRAAEWEPVAPDVVLKSSVSILECQLACASISEAVLELGCSTLADALVELDRIVSVASGIARLDVTGILRENAHLLPPPPPFSNHGNRPAGADINTVVRHVRSLVGFCPIEDLERLSQQTSRPDLGHRCRVAYDALVAFVRRNDKLSDAAGRTVGRAYAEGRLSLDEVGSLLGLGRSDAVAFLEDHGFCREARAVALGEDERAAVLARSRRERLARAGAPVVGLAQREVVASQRIEGVDARPWLPRT